MNNTDGLNEYKAYAAVDAMKKLSVLSKENGLDDMSLDKINDEINAARTERTVQAGINNTIFPISGNPKLEVLYPLIRAMNIDAREVFYPELERESPAIRQLRLIVEKCDEAEAAALIPVLESVLGAMRSQDGTNI